MNRREALALLTSLPAVERVARADVRPGSVIVVECTGLLSAETQQHLLDSVQRVFPDQRVIVCSGEVRLRVLDERPAVPRGTAAVDSSR